LPLPSSFSEKVMAAATAASAAAFAFARAAATQGSKASFEMRLDHE
jgi:hypothetical protein